MVGILRTVLRMRNESEEFLGGGNVLNLDKSVSYMRIFDSQN